jgi:hypothetical protein
MVGVDKQIHPLVDKQIHTLAETAKHNYRDVEKLKKVFSSMKEELRKKGKLKIEDFIALLDIVEQLINLI